MIYIIGIIAIVVGIASSFRAYIKCYRNPFIFIYAFFGGVLIILGSETIQIKSPKAIDYRGTTIWQVIYKDTVPIDTIIIYK